MSNFILKKIKDCYNILYVLAFTEIIFVKNAIYEV